MAKVCIECPTCRGRKRIYISTEWETSSGYYIECYDCKGTGEIWVEGKMAKSDG